MTRILAIDPGNIESAYVIMDSDTYKPLDFGKIPNEEMLELVYKGIYDEFVIENIASYGMSVGRSVFDTCIWIGRFVEGAINNYVKEYEMPINYILRAEEKMNLCYSMKAKDSNIRQALIDRFGEVGTKKEKGFFYGFKKDIWSAFAVGVTYLDKKKEDKNAQ